MQALSVNALYSWKLEPNVKNFKIILDRLCRICYLNFSNNYYFYFDTSKHILYK